MTVIHRNRFVPYKPLLNKCMASSQSSGLLAVARDSAIVDIFSMAINCTHLKRMVVLPEGVEVESMCFLTVEDDLEMKELPAGLDKEFSPLKQKLLAPSSEQYELLAVSSAEGIIRVYSPRTGRLMCSADSHGGGPVWHMVPIGNRQLFAACEDGIVRKYELSSDGLELNFVFVVDRVPSGGKIQRISYSRTVKRLAVALDDGSVRIVDLENPARTKSSIFRANAIPTALAWSSNGNTLLVGMNDGALIVVDPKISQVRSEMCHLAASINSIITCGLLDAFASGVDHRTIHLSRVSGDSKEWLKAGQRRVCNNDVIGMEFMIVGGKPVLIQGCIDGSLRLVNPFRFSSADDDRIISGLPARSIVRSSGTLLAANLIDSVSIWCHGAYNTVAEIITAEPRLVADLRFEDTIIDIDLSGDLLAVQLSSKCKLFKLGNGKVEKIGSFGSRADIIRIVGSKVVGMVQSAEGIQIHVDGECVNTFATKAFAIQMAAWERHVAVSASNCSVVVFDLVEKKTRVILFDTQPTCLSFKTDNLLAVYTIDHQCVMRNIGRETGVSVRVPDYWRNQHDNVQGIVNAESEAITLYAWSEFGICRLGEEGGEKRRKRTESEAATGLKQHDPWRSVIHFGLMNQREAVVVERPWRDVMPHLPPAFEPPKYGRQ